MAVAVGASVAAVIIIILTLICLCMWRYFIDLPLIFSYNNETLDLRFIYLSIIICVLDFYVSRRWKRDQQKAEIIRNFPPHSIATYGGGTLPLVPHPAGGGSFLPAYVDGSNFNKAAIIASQAAAVSILFMLIFSFYILI